MSVIVFHFCYFINFDKMLTFVVYVGVIRGSIDIVVVIQMNKNLMPMLSLFKS